MYEDLKLLTLDTLDFNTSIVHLVIFYYNLFNY